MQNHRILYKADNGVVAEVSPSPEALQTMSLHDIAKRVIPRGKPYKIVTLDDLPEDQTNRDSWTIDDALLTDGIGEYDPPPPEEIAVPLRRGRPPSAPQIVRTMTAAELAAALVVRSAA